MPFLEEIKDPTAGTEVGQWLNRTHGPGSPLYEDLARLIKAGVKDGWAANIEVRDSNSRRSRICEPCTETFYFSIAAVYMDSSGNHQGHAESSFRGD